MLLIQQLNVINVFGITLVAAVFFQIIEGTRFLGTHLYCAIRNFR